MPGKGRPGAPELHAEIVFVEISELAQHAVNTRTDMAHADDQPVTLIPARVAGIVRDRAVKH